IEEQAAEHRIRSGGASEAKREVALQIPDQVDAAAERLHVLSGDDLLRGGVEHVDANRPPVVVPVEQVERDAMHGAVGQVDVDAEAATDQPRAVPAGSNAARGYATLQRARIAVRLRIPDVAVLPAGRDLRVRWIARAVVEDRVAVAAVHAPPVALRGDIRPNEDRR